MYNYVGHVKKFGFEGNHSALGFKSEIKIDNSDSKKKKLFLMELTKKHNKYPSKAGLDLLYSPTKKFPGVLRQSVNNITRIFNGRAQRLFVPRFYHDRRNINFLRELKFKGEKKEIDEKYFTEEKL